jgi:hypothetical protein
VPHDQSLFLTAPDSALRAIAVRITWGAWGLFLIAACVTMLAADTGAPVNEVYSRGAMRWLSAEALYEGGTGFIYLPQSALLYIPFQLLPSAVEHVLWRIATIGLFAVGVFRLCRVAEGNSQFTFFPLVSLLVLPKTWTLALSGQATPAMAGLMMAAVAALHAKKWWRATGLLLAALAFKPLAFVFLLLVAGVYPAVRGRLAAGLALFSLIPYLFESSGYVTEQYMASVTMFEAAMKLGYTPEWSQIFALGSLLGIDVSIPWQTGIRIACAVLTLALARRVDGRTSSAGRGRNELPVSGDPCGSVSVYALATVYLLLSNPRTENNSYVLLSPVLSVSCARAIFVERRGIKAFLLASAAVLLVAGHEICQRLTPAAGFVWIGPAVCLAFAIVCWVAPLLSFSIGPVSFSRQEPTATDEEGCIEPSRRHRFVDSPDDSQNATHLDVGRSGVSSGYDRLPGQRLY